MNYIVKNDDPLTIASSPQPHCRQLVGKLTTSTGSPTKNNTD
ncbi:hypothetical protein D082_18270 [Synechocystis sp. PCC 6714]|nr:hypothetical protein D082_18270 [Synechocystis sp. PCC 6714]